MIRVQLFSPLNLSVWKMLTRFCQFVATDEKLQLEKLSNSKRAKIVKKFGDLRLKMVRLLHDSWGYLGKNRNACENPCEKHQYISMLSVFERAENSDNCLLIRNNN